MADLSAYINFSARFSLATGQLTLTDTSTYPGGVAAGITGIFSIKQPDCVTRSGVWVSPDVTYVSGALTPYNEPLRVSSNLNYQKGVYTITYQIDHPSYSPTTITKTYNLLYDRVTLVLQEDFNVFTPSLRYLDNTNYSVTGYTITSASIAWQAVFNPNGAEVINSSTSAIFDLIYSSSYWDSLYAISFAKTILYQSSSAAWVTIADVLTKNVNTSANTPPSLATLLEYIDDLKILLDADPTCNKTCCDGYKCKYIYAMTLFTHIRNRVCVMNMTNVYNYLRELILITHNNLIPPYTNTNQPLPAYDFTYCTGGSGSTTSVKIIEVIIGSAQAIALGWLTGDTVITNADFTNHLCEVNKTGFTLDGLDPLDGGQFYTKVQADDFITFSVALANNDRIKVKIFI